MYAAAPFDYVKSLLICPRSRQNPIPIEPKITGWKETPMASIRLTVVCWMYNIDNWQLSQSWDTYVVNLANWTKPRP